MCFMLEADRAAEMMPLMVTGLLGDKVQIEEVHGELYVLLHGLPIPYDLMVRIIVIAIQLPDSSRTSIDLALTELWASMSIPQKYLDTMVISNIRPCRMVESLIKSHLKRIEGPDAKTKLISFFTQLDEDYRHLVE